jgi:hypothetical protein
MESYQWFFFIVIVLMLIGGVYKYFSEMKTYIIRHVLPDKKVRNIKRDMQRVEPHAQPNRMMENVAKYVREQTEPIISMISETFSRIG